jgi:hypothetical protein
MVSLSQRSTQAEYRGSCILERPAASRAGPLPSVSRGTGDDRRTACTIAALSVSTSSPEETEGRSIEGAREVKSGTITSAHRLFR